MIVDITYKNDLTSQLVISYLNDSGHIDLHTADVADKPFKFTKWIYDDNGDGIQGYVSYDKRAVKLKYADRFNMFDLLQYIDNIDPAIKAKLLAFKQADVYSFDIETEIVDGFPDADSAATRILSVAITRCNDTLTTKVLTIDYDRVGLTEAQKVAEIAQEYITKHYKKEQIIDVEVIVCKNERELLARFLSILKFIPVMIAWNSDGYDWPYVKKRVSLNGLKMSSASIDGSVDHNGMPRHKLCVDYMNLFKAYEYSMRPYESYSLNWVSNKSLNTPKLEYPGTLKQLYEEDIVTYLAYNAIDTALVALLHIKHNLINVLYGFSMVTRLPLSESSGVLKQAESVMFNYYLTQRDKNGNIIVCPEKQFVPETRKYEGGYVKDPVKHMAKYVACFDFSSLYPSIMRTHNLSPTNLLKTSLTAEEIEKYKNDSNYTISINNRLYDNSETSAYKAVQTDLYSKRKAYQGDQFFYWRDIWFKLQEEKKRRGLIDSL